MSYVRYEKGVRLIVAKKFEAESFVATLDMAGKSVAKSIMAKILFIFSSTLCSILNEL